MAEARCFSKDVVLSDRFLRLSINARLLYFTLGVEAREKGILINARTITKLIGCSELDLNELVTNGYLREIEDGHFRIVHWYENNGVGETARKLHENGTTTHTASGVKKCWPVTDMRVRSAA